MYKINEFPPFCEETGLKVINKTPELSTPAMCFIEKQ
jgi:hypothetical protein